MNKAAILAALLALALTGCSGTSTYAEHWAKAEETCAKNDGVRRVYDTYVGDVSRREWSYAATIVCKNGGTFRRYWNAANGQ